jgi:Flp pilus assembly protein TadG
MRELLSLSRDQKGAAGVEMALMIPLLVTIMFGSFEMGHFFWSEHKVVKAVRDGARFAARQPFAKFSCANTNILVGDGSGNTDAAFVTQVGNLTRTGNIAGSGSPKVPGWVNTHITVSVSCPATPVTTGIYKGQANAPRVTVNARVPYPSLFGILGFNAVNINLNAQSQSAVMGI